MENPNRERDSADSLDRQIENLEGEMQMLRQTLDHYISTRTLVTMRMTSRRPHRGSR